MRIAIMGIRGIPANYGGFETFAEEMCTRLVKRGHHVTVYGRSHFITWSEPYYLGVRLVVLPTIKHKYFDTVVHTFLCVIHALFRRYDAILICNSANSIFSFIPRLFGTPVAVNVDGIERLRKKWNILGKCWYRVGEWFSTVLPNEMVSDARVIEQYYLKQYRKKSTQIPYGASTDRVSSTGALERFGVVPEGYILYVSRLEPENNAHVVIDAFSRVRTEKKLLIVGDAPYSEKYIRTLRNRQVPGVVFTGYVFGVGYKELQCHAFAYVHATDVGGTHPALIEAMGYGNCVLANGTPENTEVVGDAAIIYQKNDVEDLSRKLQDILDDERTRRTFQKRARIRAAERYNWDEVTARYEKLFERMNGK